MTRIIVLRAAIRQARIRAPFRIDSWVVLPNHTHCLWTAAFAGAGSCPRVTPTSPVGGVRSRSRSRNRCPPVNRDHQSWPAEANAAFGSGGTENIPSAMIRTLRLTWTTFISTRPPTLPSPGGGGGLGRGNIRRIGRILRFAGVWPTGSIRQDGRAVVMNRARQASSRKSETGSERSAVGAVRGGMRYAVPPYACSHFRD